MTDTGKHSALRQTGDGSFEIVFEAGLHEVSEEEPSLADVSVAELRPASPRTSQRVRAIALTVLVLITVLAIAGWFALGPTKRGDRDVEDVPGFKPYGGSAEPTAGRTPRPLSPRPVAAIGEKASAQQPAEITEDEPGWELTEPGADAVVENEAPDDRALEEPAPDGAEPDIETADPRTRVLGRRSLPGFDPNVARGLQPAPMPNFNPRAAERLRTLPVRQIGAAAAIDEVSAEEEAPDEEVAEEVAIEPAGDEEETIEEAAEVEEE